MRVTLSRRRPLSMPVAALLVAAGTVASVCAIAWAVQLALRVGGAS